MWTQVLWILSFVAAFVAAFVAGVILKRLFYRKSREFFDNKRNLKWKGKRF